MKRKKFTGTKQTSMESDVTHWIKRIEEGVKAEFLRTGSDDASHDIGHLQRVSTLSMQFAKAESGNELIVYAAGMLHDIVNLPKNDPESHKSSFLASVRAKELLISWRFPNELIPNVCHAIHAHSFTANIEPQTIEAKCLQDADRMEALGAFGLMRTFYVSGKLGTQILDEEDPAGNHRKIDDKTFALDHFVKKLFTLSETMKTENGAKTAKSLTIFLRDYRNGLIQDCLDGNNISERFTIANIYYQAGQKKLSLFHPEDPFAEKGRKRDLEQYALDVLLGIQDPYILKFKNQLRFELNGYMLCKK